MIQTVFCGTERGKSIFCNCSVKKCNKKVEIMDIAFGSAYNLMRAFESP